jgi:hypothetical protein
MKNIFPRGLFLFFGLLMIQSFGQKQSNCTVVDNENAGVYIGKCKNGLADGDGVFEFMNGKYIFHGKFKKGLKHGEGKLFSVIDGNKKLIKEGLWKKNKYVGVKSKQQHAAYKVLKRVNIERYSVRHVGDGNKVKFVFMQNGNRNIIQNLTMIGDSGTMFSSAYNQSLNEGFENITFPFKCEVTYTTLSKLKYQTLTVRFEVLIMDPGTWEITFNN